VSATYPWRSHAMTSPSRHHDLPSLLRLKPEDLGVAPGTGPDDHVTWRSQLPPEVDPFDDDPLVSWRLLLIDPSLSPNNDNAIDRYISFVDLHACTLHVKQ